MKYVKIEEIDEKEGIVYMRAFLGGNIPKQIIPEIQQEIQNYNTDWRVRVTLNDAPLEITHDMSIEDIIDCWKKGGNLRQKSIYKTINELIDDVNKLGDWRTEKGVKEYLKVLARINNILDGYEYEIQNQLFGKQNVTGIFPKEVTDAIKVICRDKFPKDSEVFTEDGNIKEGLPDTANYLTLVHNNGLSILNQRTDIAYIGRNMYVYPKKYGKEDATSLIKSAKKFMEKCNNTFDAKHKNEENF
ncbi:MAG: hypothetical protein IKR12_01630 [Clostridia bacterium]|nr:hypothetical protein [Clostridia bacterium]